MRVLVTGATGFVGGYIVERLSDQGYEILCLVRENSNTTFLQQFSNIKFWTGDLTDEKSIHGISQGIDYVIHLAAKGDVAAMSQSAYKDFLHMNGTGTANLLNEFKNSKQLKKFVHFSSTAAMGIIGKPVLNEESKPNPQTPYQFSKLKSEELVLDAYKKFEVPTVILRPCMIYGERGNKGEYYKFCKLMKKGLFPKVGSGKNLTPMVYVTDVADAAILAMQNGKIGNIYIIADDKSYCMDDLRQEVVKNLNVHVPYLYVPAWMGLLGAVILEKLFILFKKPPIVTYKNIKSTIIDRTFDISKARKELGYAPQIHMPEGTKKTIAWLKKHGDI